MPERPSITRSVTIAATPETLYDMIADVPRMGEWSPACTGATWDEGAGPTLGSWFTGHNKAADREYDRRCQITDAQRPTTIAWMAGGQDEGFTEWRYRFEPVVGGTAVTETWSMVRDFPQQTGDSPVAGMDPEELQKRMLENFGTGIEQTLARLKESLEA
jgi:uncharacterized protein YndB with AHSA1/START domain